MSFDAGIYAGCTLGRYELLVPIAQGASASVWAAIARGSRGFEKIVAVKAMLTELEDQEMDAESMFLDEARLVSRIRHPNVVEVLDLGEQDGALFIVMEWIEGEPLQIVSREAKKLGGIPLPLAVRIVTLAAAGLHAAHELRDEQGKLVNLVHRDVSPQNILVGYDGAVKVIDFGVAKAAMNHQRTTVGQVKGKVGFMAPEQAFGYPVDRRTDVFAMGIVLYQLVTGKHPFRGDNEFVTMGRIRDKTPVEPAISHVPDLPAELNRVLMKALSKDQDGRWASMLGLKHALEAAVPLAQDHERDLGELMRSLLAKRAEKRMSAIREAIRLSNEGSKLPARAVVASIFDDDEHAKAPTPAPSSAGAAVHAAVRDLRQVASAPSQPAVSVANGAAAAVAAPAIAAHAAATPVAAIEPMPEFRNRRPMMIAVLAVGITLAIAILAVVLSGPKDTGPGEPPTTKRPW